ncbi:hypothetical protein ACFVH4_14640 [Nocardia ignorata]|uniref:hypothetical protein n=1 Tax=Nocardia ignorata TaxID=145285 RepID=UPI003639B9CC
MSIKGRWLAGLLLIVVILAAATYCYARETPNSVARRHAEETVITGYERVHFESNCGNTGCAYEYIYLVDAGDGWVDKISGPGLTMGGRFSLAGAEPYNWGMRGKFEDGCHMTARPLDPASEDMTKWDIDPAGMQRLRAGDLTLVRLGFVCGEG